MSAPFKLPPADPIATQMPSLLMDECSPHMRKALAYLEVMHQLGEIEDEMGFIVAADKMLDEAREIARLLKEIKKRFRPENQPDKVPLGTGEVSK
jgi:hypothetical protein